MKARQLPILRSIEDDGIIVADHRAHEERARSRILLLETRTLMLALELRQERRHWAALREGISELSVVLDKRHGQLARV